MAKVGVHPHQTGIDVGVRDVVVELPGGLDLRISEMLLSFFSPDSLPPITKTSLSSYPGYPGWTTALPGIGPCCPSSARFSLSRLDL
jgi:hypothetical protein